ncbi:amino acid regulated cytosolic protein [Oceaniovalibus guishaninsula JLT2003]|uniref:Amino acid regulated cytosolic protein n=1 Tax=Oceaniovalibus guishaninsula JLT2003 TaxID=1231392 RepID=K2HA01_9RHOB|nr:YcjX family protein [Oceaniovalibus guishaninsula]EKE43452.1 amino acid regulated cytosolic protein [Oceaniovalibus guishaninsula JLT2003]
MIIGDIADGVLRRAERVGAAVTGLAEPSVRLGVTGLSRAGKTVFITSLVANLLDRGRMPGLAAAADGSIRAAWLQPQPDDTLPRFAFEDHLAAMTGPDPRWPESTRAISELRVSLRVQSAGLIGGLRGLRTVHVDIVDYPGEWLLDLGLMGRDYATWAGDTLARIRDRPEAAAYGALLEQTDPAQRLDERRAQALAEAFTAYLQAARAAGWSDCTPGRFLLPGDLAGSPVLTFAPVPGTDFSRGSLGREMARRFDAYKRQVVTPFFRDHFSRIERQAVLVDVLGAIHAGPPAVEDMRRAMAEILGAFRPGRNAWLTRLLPGRKVERILFAATRADHLHHTQHSRLAAITAALLDDARRRADFAGAKTTAMAIASLRATTEDTVEHGGAPLPVVRGVLQDSGRRAALHAGDLPDDPALLLAPARAGQARWLDGDWDVMRFAPQAGSLRPGSGPPHIRLDRAAQFLLGDRL